MKLIKISPKFQITIPKTSRHLCHSGWFALTDNEGIIVLRPIEIQEAKTDQEILDDIMNEINGGTDGI
ncbi:MAG: hypothetical protein ABIH78_04265 [Candidatus Peregrinibacteria bacterium]